MKDYQANVERINSGANRFLRRVFSEFVVEGPQLTPEDVQCALLVASTHRSHADYFIVGALGATMGVKNLRFAAGDNLTRLPIIGPRFTALGAFTVKRGGAFARNYVRDLCEQVVGMLATGDNIVVFPEGGRSYGGQMLEMKAGITSAAIMLRGRGAEHKVAFLPMAISYECLPELQMFDFLDKGKQFRKKKGLLNAIIGNLLYFGADIIAFSRFSLAPRFGWKYGAVYIDYGKPILVEDLVDIEANRLPEARDEFSSHRVSMQQLCDKLHPLLFSYYRILPSHVLAHVLTRHTVQTIEQAGPLCEEVVGMLKTLPRNLKAIQGLSGEELARIGAAQLARMKGLRLRGSKISISKPWVIRYYAATIQEEQR